MIGQRRSESNSPSPGTERENDLSKMESGPTRVAGGSDDRLVPNQSREHSQTPTAQLAKFKPFLGKYDVSGDFAKLPWSGTLGLSPAIKGWFVEQTILVKSEDIDREFQDAGDLGCDTKQVSRVAFRNTSS